MNKPWKNGKDPNGISNSVNYYEHIGVRSRPSAILIPSIGNHKSVRVDRGEFDPKTKTV